MVSSLIPFGSSVDSKVIFEVNGTPYQNFKSIRLSKSLEGFAHVFDAVATRNLSDEFPIKPGDEVSIYLDNIIAFTGYVEFFDDSLDSGSHEMAIGGRSKTLVCLKSNAIRESSFNPKAQFRDIIFKLLNRNGIKTENILSKDAKRGKDENFIGIIDLANPSPFDVGDVVDAKVGDNLFELMEKYAQKRQVLLNTDAYGNIVITRGSSDLVDSSLVMRTPKAFFDQTRQTNILSRQYTRDDQDRYNKYIIKSQSNLSALPIGSSSSPIDITNKQGEAVDSDMNQELIRVLIDDSDSNQTAQERATWEANIARARSIKYNCVVQGFKPDGITDQLWEQNKLIKVIDDTVKIDSNMLISSVDFTFSSDSGSQTALQLISPDSYSLQAEQNEVESRSNQFIYP